MATIEKPARAWLVKSEPDVYPIEALERDGETGWEGVRNYLARNHLRAMQAGDPVLFYHSSTEPPGVAGVARVARPAYPDETALDRRSPYFDPKATAEDPRWSAVRLAFVERFPGPVTLDALKAEKALAGLEVTRQGSRLSVTQVEPAHFERIVALGRKARPLSVAAPKPAKPKPLAKPKPKPKSKPKPKPKRG